MAASKMRVDVGASVPARAAPRRTSGPITARARTLAPTSLMKCLLIRHLRDRTRRQTRQKTANFPRVVLGIGGKHDQEKSVLGGKSEARGIEYRMVGHRQPVEG